MGEALYFDSAGLSIGLMPSRVSRVVKALSQISAISLGGFGIYTYEAIEKRAEGYNLETKEYNTSAIRTEYHRYARHEPTANTMKYFLKPIETLQRVHRLVIQEDRVTVVDVASQDC